MAETKSSSKADEKATKTRKPRTAAALAGDLQKPATGKKAAKAMDGGSAEKKTGRKGSAKVMPGNNAMSAEEHYRMVEVAAYFLAERNNFAGNPSEYWTQAEAQISSMLSK